MGLRGGCGMQGRIAQWRSARAPLLRARFALRAAFARALCPSAHHKPYNNNHRQ